MGGLKNTLMRNAVLALALFAVIPATAQVSPIPQPGVPEKPTATDIRGFILDMPLITLMSHLTETFKIDRCAEAVLAPCQVTKSGQNETIKVTTNKPEAANYTFEVINGLLAKITMYLHDDVTFDAFVSQAIEKYGKPTATYSEALQNAFGANFPVKRTRWEMPDGAIIFAHEQVNISQYGVVQYTEIDMQGKVPQEKANPLL